jgi:hypothetical protein
VRTYKILFIDDEKQIIDTIMGAVQNLLSLERGYKIEYFVLNKPDEIENMNNMAADIVLFDCAMNAAPLNFGDCEENTFGVNLMKEFRKKNTRTKIIFYSGEFSLYGTQCYNFTNEEMLYLLNDLHIYKMVPKKVEYISGSIVEAIDELDAVIMSLEDLKEEYHSCGDFLVNNELYSIDDIIIELKNGTELGEKFRKNVLKMVLTYMMKFGGDEE